MSDDFKACQKAANIAVPKNGMTISLSPGKTTEDFNYFDVVLHHNFERGAKDLTKDDKTLFLIAQGILELTMEHGDMVMEKGYEVMNKFLKGLGGEPETVDLEKITPQGSC